MKIRHATISDLKKIQELNHMLCRKEHDEYDRTIISGWPFSADGRRYFTARIRDGCVLVALSGNDVVGYLAGCMVKKKSYRSVSKIAELENMFVLEGFRSSGIGSVLCSAFREWCMKKGARRISVVASAKNRKGIRFYRKSGFSDHTVTLESVV